MKKHVHLSLLFAVMIVGYGTTVAQWTIDTITFEAPVTSIWMDTTGSNVWQIGQPQKPGFDSAHSGSHAIITDTVNAYPPHDTSSFIYIIRNPYTQTCLTCMSFWHKYEMDTDGDKGILDASYDGGTSWVSVEDSFYVFPLGSSFTWDPDFHESDGSYTDHPVITSGTSEGWIKSRFCWQWYLPVHPDTIIANPDSLLILFTFISDSIPSGKAGWMIDDIVTSSAGGELCSATREVSDQNGISVYPNPFSEQTVIETEHDFKNTTLTLSNALGQRVKQLNDVAGKSVILTRDNLPCGFYVLQLLRENKLIATLRLIIAED